MRVVIAMSGGVDSSVAAARLIEQGHEVIGVHLRQHDGVSGAADSTPRCCGVDDAMDARRVAHALDIPFFVMDLRDEFRATVIDYFADSYLAGLTPNPCVPCNGVLRFGVLLRHARSLGASHLATGHYARARSDGRLFKAADAHKDQTYFLFQLRPEAVAQTFFPLGDLTKAQVRARARALDLVTAHKPESQDICFVPDGDHHGFIRRHRPDAQGAGDIVSEDGEVLGQHRGYWRYTVGQRRGLGVALGHPAYVVRVDATTRQVVVGTSASIQHAGLRARDLNWIRRPETGEALSARIRHRGTLYPCAIKLGDHDDAVVHFDSPARAVTPGQAVVFYADDELLGGGWIQETIR